MQSYIDSYFERRDAIEMSDRRHVIFDFHTGQPHMHFLNVSTTALQHALDLQAELQLHVPSPHQRW